MRSLATRLFAAFSLAFAAVSAVFLVIAHVEGVRLLGASMILVAVYGGAMAVAFAALAGSAAERISGPVEALNDQLDAIEPGRSRRVNAISSDQEMRALEEHVNALLARVDDSVHQLRDYATQVAHELRTPLTVLRLKIEQAAGAIDPQLAEDLQAEVLRLAMMVEQSLMIARAEQGALEAKKSLVDLKDLVGDVAQDFQLMAQDQGRSVSVSSCSAPVMADPKMMRQVFYSLLTNSLRHGVGPVTVRLREMRSGFSVLIVNRVSAEPTTRSGLGLGLRVASALVRLHDNARLRTLRRRDHYAVCLFFAAS